MTFFMLGDTIINGDLIAYVRPIGTVHPSPTGVGPGQTVVTGATIHFDGGSELAIRNPRAIAFLEAWAAEVGHPVRPSPY